MNNTLIYNDITNNYNLTDFLYFLFLSSFIYSILKYLLYIFPE